MSANHAAAEPFWRFSLMVYARPGVAKALIALQDRAGHNVNLILYGLWLGVCQGARLDGAGIVRARRTIERLDRDVVMPLRRLRRVLKDDPDQDMRDLRRRVLALEIAAERRVQARLARTAPAGDKAGDRRAIAEANLRLVLGSDAASPEAEMLRAAIAPR
ncbi:MAG TPA: TIGR02444 family protein [Stellaceae bacterium]|nr:TIGR02444 family protein [Stellaceae bacterium]